MPSRPKSKPGKKNPGSGKGGRRPWPILIGTVLLALLLGALIFLAHRYESRGVAPARLPSPPPAEPAKSGPVQRHSRPQPTPTSAPRPQVAIVMDDLGRSLAVGRELLAIDLPVTFAILPGEAHATEVAELAHRHGREILIHLPMEPQGYPVTNPGDDALLVGMPTAEIHQRLEDFRRRVPHAVGANNHMGSRFTEDREGMQAVLTMVKAADLFFLDSLTSGKSVAYAEARQAQIPAAVRDLFLDNVQDVETIEAELQRLLTVAKERGRAIGICHPYPQTLEALQRSAADLRQAGIDLVPVARLVEN